MSYTAADRRGIFVKGPGKGSKVCPNCNRIVSGPRSKSCKGCKAPIPVFKDIPKNRARAEELATRIIAAEEILALVYGKLASYRNELNRLKNQI